LKGHGKWGSFPRTGEKPSVTPMGKKGTTSQSTSPQSSEADGAIPPGNYFQTHESYEEYSARIYKVKNHTSSTHQPTTR